MIHNFENTVIWEDKASSTWKVSDSKLVFPPPSLVLQFLLGPHCKKRTDTLQLLYWSPFESRVVTYYSCCWGPLQKQKRVLTCYSGCWGTFESGVLTHSICSWDLFENRVLTHYRMVVGPPLKAEYLQIAVVVGAWGPFWKQSTCLRSASEYIISVDNRFLPKPKKRYTQKHLEGGP